MCARLTASLKQFPDRPYGEFVPGGNAASAEGTVDVFRRLREVAMDYKGAKKRPKPSRKPESPDAPSRKQRREQRKLDRKKK